MTKNKLNMQVSLNVMHDEMKLHTRNVLMPITRACGFTRIKIIKIISFLACQFINNATIKNVHVICNYHSVCYFKYEHIILLFFCNEFFLFNEKILVKISNANLICFYFHFNLIFQVSLQF